MTGLFQEESLVIDVLNVRFGSITALEEVMSRQSQTRTASD